MLMLDWGFLDFDFTNIILRLNQYVASRVGASAPVSMAATSYQSHKMSVCLLSLKPWSFKCFSAQIKREP